MTPAEGSYVQKVLWDEGLLLQPQHFQQAARHQRHFVRERLRALRPLDWGWTRLQIEGTSLPSGSFALREVAGVLPSGAFVAAPGQDSLPAPLNLGEHFPAGQERLRIYLGMPAEEPGRPVVGSEHTPYGSAQATIQDESGSSEAAELTLARQQLRLIASATPPVGFAALPVAEVRRSGGGSFELDPDFTPPLQLCSAGPRTQDCLRRVLEALAHRGADLRARREGRGVDVSAAELGAFFFLQVVSSHLPLLRDLLAEPHVHPHELYRGLAHLAGALAPFSAAREELALPAYDHARPSAWLLPLEATLLELLGTALPTRCVTVRLERERDLVWGGKINDERLLQEGEWYLIVGGLDPDQAIRELPIKAKLAAADRLDELIVRALPGLGLRHVLDPPPELPAGNEQVVFRLQSEGPHWDALAASRQLGLYLPSDLSAARLVLAATRGS